MKKYVPRFATLLKLKHLKVRKEQLQLLSLQSEVNKKKQLLQTFQQQIQETEVEAHMSKGSVDIEKQQMHEAFFFALYEKIDLIEQTLVKINKEILIRKRRLAEAERGRKVIEKIHQKDYDQWESKVVNDENRDFYPRKTHTHGSTGSS